jgi:hypothetical protein
MLEKFRSSFNSEMDADFRFDVDCKAELLLRSLELGDELWSLCDDRKKNVESIIADVANDGMARLFLHRVQCEGAALLQSELSRFVVSVDVILDVSKSLLSYDYETMIANPLEETLPIPDSVYAEGRGSPSAQVDGKDGRAKAKDAKAAAPKGNAKGGKDGKDVAVAPVPYRVPVSEMLLNSELMLSLPEAKEAAAEEPVDTKKGGKAAALPKVDCSTLSSVTFPCCFTPSCLVVGQEGRKG